METGMIKKYTRTNIFMLDRTLWNWAQYRSKELGYNSVSEYLFELIKQDKEKDIIGG